MLVYSTTLWLAQPTDMDSILSVVASWLSRKTHENIPVDSLKSTAQRRMRDGSGIQTVRSDSSFPILQAVRYSHADIEVSGRQWITEVGLRQETTTSEIECSVLLRTSEISARVDTRVHVTRPLFVRDLVEQLTPSGRTCGLSVKRLDDQSAEAFRYVIEDEERRYPIILVSPKTENNYPVDISKLSSLVVGLADLVQIQPGADTFFIARVIGEQYASWRGAVNLIFQKVRSGAKRFIPTKRLMLTDIEELTASGVQPETEILSIITHRTNLPNSWRHISPELVAEANLRHELSLRREEASKTGAVHEYIELLESVNSEQDAKTSKLKEDVQCLEGLLTEYEEENRLLKSTNESLKASLSRAGSREIGTSGEGFSEPVRNAFVNLIRRSPTPKDSLLIIATLFPDHVAVLESAWKSAEKSESFKDREKLFELLWKLVTNYRDALCTGKSDAEARTLFGKSYSARESETVESNRRARSLRTFEYSGQTLEMMKHLRIGAKDSVSETIRIHFEWDSTTKRVIIGHCGPHLDHR